MSVEPSKDMIFISGMFRSGTTLLGRMLNAHPHIAIASDPYLPFFKMFRSDVASLLGINISYKFPLQDYYFSFDHQELFHTLQSLSFQVPFDRNNFPFLRKEIKSYGSPYAPLIMDHLEEIDGDTYSEVFLSMLNIIDKCYAKGAKRVIGFKEVWADEFIPCMARDFSNLKFIQIVRDPRAVCASKNVTSARYPWIFLCRQWRKLAALAWAYQQDDSLKNKVLIIRFEDLITQPEVIAKKICIFLNLKYDSAMVNPEQYVNGSGKPWKQNTSFGPGKKQFDHSALTRWKNVLSERECAFIEMLCWPEMQLHNYQLTYNNLDPVDFSLMPPKISDKDLAIWIKEIFPNDTISNSTEIIKEQLRYNLLKIDKNKFSDIEPSLIEASFLFQSLFKEVKFSL
jgi:hypothetical protein